MVLSDPLFVPLSFMCWHVRLFVLLVVYCYAAIAPLLLPVACLLYLGSYLVYKNQALYVYVQTAESGGAVRPLCLGLELIVVIAVRK